MGAGACRVQAVRVDPHRAQAANLAAMAALSKVVPSSQIVLGTDFPYRTSLNHVKGLRDSGVFNEAELRMIEQDTPMSLLPRVRR